MTPSISTNQRAITRDHYHQSRLRVTLHAANVHGHRLVRAGRFLLTGRRPAWDGKIVLMFENMFAESRGPWLSVSGKSGIIRIPVSLDESVQYMEQVSYMLYLYQW